MGLMIDLSPAVGPVLVVGGGRVAVRKVEGVLAAGFSVTVVAPEVDEWIRDAAAEVRERAFEERDLDGFALVFACTDLREVNRRVGEAAKQRGILVNVADRPEESTFASPAIHRDGVLTVGVSTGGASPGTAAEIRDRIARELGEGWGARLAEAGEARSERLRERREVE
jgi:siroheme synthase-like protein